MTHRKFSKTKGFTLIELLAVIAIIGILAAVVMPNLSGTKELARDSERISEVSEIALAVEMYYNQCRQYPSTLTTTANNGSCPSGVTLGSFLSSIPVPPTGGSYDYASNGTSYVVHATLETSHKKLADDVDGTVFSVNCADDTLNYCKKG